jgi:hypothetical protein
MVPGDDEILGCPSCGAPHRRGSLVSDNIEGARWWSDGKIEAPMLPSRPLVTRCRQCGRYFAIHRSQRLGHIEGPGDAQYRDFVLVDAGPRRAEVLALLHRHFRLAPARAEALLAELPYDLVPGASRDKARELIEEFQRAGATARVRPVLRRPLPPRVSVVLTEVGPRRVEVMALLRENSQVSLAEVKGLLEHLPLPLPLRPPAPPDFEALLEKLRAAGATVTTRELPSAEEEPLPGEAFPPEWRELPELEELPEEELLAALAEGVALDRAEERELRRRAWWAGNDPYRDPETPWKPFAERAPAARENLRLLLELFDPDEPLDGLLKAEALRELERFDEAMALLARVPLPDELHKVAEQLRRLAEQRVPEVRVTIGS